jgi:hypothetical protein
MTVKKQYLRSPKQALLICVNQTARVLSRDPTSSDHIWSARNLSYWTNALQGHFASRVERLG